ncbi:MAG TPA: glycosyltransferase [Candidatus Nitrosocosmicus sp.]|nr:glycosyltransferase [Candidatus Nitrosocosmicus sp.]
MKVNFVYSDLNPCGGAEKLSLITMQSFIELGINIDLTSLEFPDSRRIQNAFGKELASVLESIREIHILDTFNERSIEKNILNDYKLVFNSHGDIDPYYHKSRNKFNTITYCHYPTAKFLIKSRDEEYLDRYLKISRFERSGDNDIESITIPRSNNQISLLQINNNKYLQWLEQTYDNMLMNSSLVTNSQYSHNQITKTLGISDTMVIYPPVDVDKFRDMSLIPSLNKGMKENDIVVICRIDPAKKVENVIFLAQKLREAGVNLKITIIGNLDPYHYYYYKELKKTIIDQNLDDRIFFKTDASLEDLFDILSKSGIIFHPKPGEHFGISIVEAMSAGLVPVVPSVGGPTEFVPIENQYDSIETAVKIIQKSQDIKDIERIRTSNSVRQFSTQCYKAKIKKLVLDLLNGIDSTSLGIYQNLT